MSGCSAARSFPRGGVSPSTMMVIRMAMTPSLKASRRPLLTFYSLLFHWIFFRQAAHRGGFAHGGRHAQQFLKAAAGAQRRVAVAASAPPVNLTVMGVEFVGGRVHA